jgi:hypothetical protein
MTRQEAFDIFASRTEPPTPVAPVETPAAEQAAEGRPSDLT